MDIGPNARWGRCRVVSAVRVWRQEAAFKNTSLFFRGVRCRCAPSSEVGTTRREAGLQVGKVGLSGSG